MALGGGDLSGAGGLIRWWKARGCRVGVADDDTPATLTPTARLLATCSADQTCKIWRTSNFSLMTELSIKSSNPGESSRGWMWGCAFSGDSQYIVTGEPHPPCLPAPLAHWQLLLPCHLGAGLQRGPAWGCILTCCPRSPSLQLPLTTWPGSGVWRQERSKGSTAATRKPWSAWLLMTACWASLCPGGIAGSHPTVSAGGDCSAAEVRVNSHGLASTSLG